MPLIYFEDLATGDSFESDEIAVDETEMLAYNRLNDPWPMHIDAASASGNPYGSLIASGGYTISLMYRLGHRIYNTPERQWAVLAALEWQVKFPGPVRANDRVRLRITVKDKHESSRPNRGHFSLLYELLKHDDTVALSVLMAGLIARRPPAPG